MARDANVVGFNFSAPRTRRLWRRYTRATRRPLYSILFLAPLIVAYEIAAAQIAADHAPARELLARGAIQSAMQWVGLVGGWVPAAIMLITLLAWHHLSRDRWRFRWWVPVATAGEGLLLALPLLVLSAFFVPHAPAGRSIATALVAAVGAGVYEELLFRLLLIGALTWLWAGLVGLRRPTARGLAIALAPLLFALCHLQPIGLDPFAWKSFWFLTAAGTYLSLVYVGRGLGVAAACHIACNLLLVGLRSL